MTFKDVIPISSTYGVMLLPVLFLALRDLVTLMSSPGVLGDNMASEGLSLGDRMGERASEGLGAGLSSGDGEALGLVEGVS